MKACKGHAQIVRAQIFCMQERHECVGIWPLKRSHTHNHLEVENSLHICIYPHICKVRFAKEQEIHISICVCIYLSSLISD